MLVGIWGYNDTTETSIAAGKDTVAGLIQTHTKECLHARDARDATNLVCEIIPLALKLKHILSDVFGIPLENCFSQEGKAASYEQLSGNTLRMALQHLGTEGFRGINPNVWINYLLRQDTSKKLILTPDVRFESEAQAIRSVGGCILGVYRTNNPSLCTQPEVNSYIKEFTFLKDKIHINSEAHTSEQDLHKLINYTDFMLYNNSSVSNLSNQVKLLVEQELIPRWFSLFSSLS